MLSGKRILLGIGGGVAVYRVAELARLLIKAGAEVRCIMTRSATEFVTPLTFEALTGHEVYSELFDLTAEREMGHIKLARWADAVVVAPTTANLMARLAHGIADDLLTTLLLANNAPTLIAPAMNSVMWHSEATQRNLETLKSRDIRCAGPNSGELACGEQGEGRLAEPQQIIDALLPLVTAPSLKGERWVINAGPTIESWDGVRTLSNRASGRLGSLIASHAAAMGAEVTLIAGPGTPATAATVRRVDVENGEQMLSACLEQAADADSFIASAAVSDFRFAEPLSGKLKRSNQQTVDIKLVANPDIVASISAMPERPKRVIAFAAEAENHIENARAKLAAKGVNGVVANDIANIGSQRAGGWWITEEHAIAINSDSKAHFAESIIHHIRELSR